MGARSAPQGSIAGLRAGQASLMGGKPAEAVDGAVQAILHLCEAAEAQWGEPGVSI
jgi:hypothetical protein